MESYLWLGVQSCGSLEDDVRRSWWGVWTGVVAKTKVYSAPTGLEFQGVGSRGKTGKARGQAGEIGSNFCIF